MDQTPWKPIAPSWRRDEWLEKRKIGIGASEIAAVMYENPWQPAIKVWLDKTGSSPPEEEEEESERQFWGQELEHAILTGYARRTGRIVVPWGILIQSTQWPWLCCTPDALIAEDEDAHVIARTLKDAILDENQDVVDQFMASPGVQRCWPLQVKNTGEREAQSWVEGPPRYYQLQGLHEALVFGSPKATVAGLIGGQHLAWQDVHVDEFEQRKLINLSKRFWQEHVLTGIEPVPDGSDECKRMLAAMFPEEDPEKQILFPSEIHLDNNPAPFGEVVTADDFDAMYVDALARRKAAKDEVKRLENIARGLMGNAAQAILPSGAIYSLRSRSVPERVQSAWTARVLTRRKAPAKPKTKRKKKRDG